MSEQSSEHSTEQYACLRLSITLPGSASLGAFQGGAMAALSVMIRSLRTHGVDVRIDAMGGSSAGSIVAMLFGHCMVTGRDAPALLRDAWVDEVDLELLRSGGSRAPLAFDDLRSRMESFLSDTDDHPFAIHEPIGAPIDLHVGLTSLLGFTTDIETQGSQNSTLSYTDWMSFELEPRSGHEAITEPRGRSPLDAVLVSASHPGAFAPRALDRSSDRAAYERRGVTNFPDEGVLWYSDGGLVESEPVGRVLAAARAHEASDDDLRLHLVVDPRSSGPSGDRRWASPEADPSWIDGVRRALSVLPTQALHDDLRAIAGINGRLDEFATLRDDILARCGDDADDLIDRIAALAGLEDKEHIDLAIISPLLQAEGEDEGVSDLLAGDFIGAFGGFLDRSIRRSDFALGWACTRRWIDEGLESRGIDRDLVDAVLHTVDASADVNWSDVALEQDSTDQLGVVGRWHLALLAWRIGYVLVREAVPSPLAAIRRRVR